MSCEVTYEELAAFLAGDVPPERAESIRRHVDGCESCSERLAHLREVDASLSRLERTRPSPGALLGLRRALAEELRPRREVEVMTLDEVAEFLRLSPSEMDEIVEELPLFEIAGRLRVRRARLVEWIEERERRFARDRAVSETVHVLEIDFARGVA